LAPQCLNDLNLSIALKALLNLARQFNLGPRALKFWYFCSFDYLEFKKKLFMFKIYLEIGNFGKTTGAVGF